MRFEELKKGFWGYQKESVLRYIAAQEESFSQRLLEKDDHAKQAVLQSQARIQELEQEVRELREELAQLRRHQDQIPNALLDARASAQALRDQANAQEQIARENLRRALEADLSELAGYRERIQSLGKAIREALEQMEQQSQALQEAADGLAQENPSGNLQLFA